MRIAVTATIVGNLDSATRTLRRITGEPVNLMWLYEGALHRRPVVEYVLFRADHARVAAALRRLMSRRIRTLAPRFFEVPADRPYYARARADYREIAPATLARMLAMHDEMVAYVRADADYRAKARAASEA